MSRNAKHNWDLHFPRMVQLYKQELSIPKIRKVIMKEVDDFRPKSSIFYKKFRDEGFPTDPVVRKKYLASLNGTAWDSTNSTTVAFANPQSMPTTSTPPENATDEHISSSYVPNSYHNNIRSLDDSLDLSGQHDHGEWSANLCDRTLPTEQASHPNFLKHPEYFGSLQLHTSLPVDNSPLSNPFGNTAESISRSTNNSTTPRAEHLIFLEEANHSIQTSVSNFQGMKSDFSCPVPFYEIEDEPKQPSYNMSPSVSTGRSVPWAKAKPRYNRSCTPEKRSSISTSDSGYASGRNSPLTSLAEDGQIHPRSLFEFKGLYRVPCLVLHEPQPLSQIFVAQPYARFKDVPRCNNCHYSAIHNLSWSCRQLKFEVFMAELKLHGVYDVTALDATGNSALHYAAAGGAEPKHLNALIDLGVDPSQINTAGQLFLHYLTPYIRHPGFDSVDDGLVSVFVADLINLMNDYQPNGAFDWPDNQGFNPLDSLALRLSNHGLKQKVLRDVAAAGFSAQVADQFTKFKKLKLARAGTLHFGAKPANHAPRNDWAEHQEKQIKACEIIQNATKDPTYIDPDTGDNLLHALARFRSKPRDLVFQIEDGIRKGACLTTHNFVKDYPLATFVQERPLNCPEGDETGPTLSKYLDALIWKDPLRRVPNRINVNARNREAATALHYAALRGRPDSVRSLIEGGANVNARLGNNGKGISILRAAFKGRAKAVMEHDKVAIDRFNSVISYLEYENAVPDPTLREERALAKNSVMIMPM